MFKSEKQKWMSYIVFTIYFLALIWLILFKLQTNFIEYFSLRNSRSINLIPFYYDVETSSHFKEVIYNILVFIPLGIYVNIFKNSWSVSKKILSVFLVSLSFELLQFILAIGASDITDVIGNTFGGFLGIASGIWHNKRIDNKHITVINIIGIVLEVIVISFIIFLLIVNS